MNNLEIYNKVRSVPEEAKKPIKGGRLSGMTDINPMWRIKTLTEQFGACGVGWKYEICNMRLERATDDEVAAFVDVNLYFKTDNGWSEAIPGTGGSAFVTKERNGIHVSDECFKMALTDALSVACKALGFGADVYWDKDKTKYDEPGVDRTPQIKAIETEIDRFAKARGKEYTEAYNALMEAVQVPKGATLETLDENRFVAAKLQIAKWCEKI